MKWYYSERLQLYISLEPLKISNQVFRIAKQHGIALDWDDYGNVVMLDFAEFKILVHELGGMILSPAEYWQLYEEACEKSCEPLKNSLMSSRFTEILDRVYIDDHTYIDHCNVVGDYEYEGERIQYEPVVGRPGWIGFEDIDLETGHPRQVHENTGQKPQMKYWSPDLPNTEVKKAIALRGYVTSVAMPSLDLGIPADTRQPKMMVRFCTRHKPKELAVEENKTQGFLLTFEAFKEYLLKNGELLEEALRLEKMLTFVCGHRNPDADTVVSCVLEAYHRYVENRDADTVYLPLIQSDEMPKEIAYILGQEITEALLYAEKLPMSEWLKTGKIRFVFTDQNYQKEYQKYVVAILDHHRKNKELENGTLEIPCEIKEMGSCTALIAQKCLEQGYDFDVAFSKILYSAMLMDTENRVPHKMSPEDVRLMDLFREKAGVVSDRKLYETIMDYLISEKDGEKLYRRDYKHYYGFGFSVLKVTHIQDAPDFEDWISKVLELAKADNVRHNDYFTLVKLVDYQAGGRYVNRERIYWVWNHEENLYLIEKTKELIEKLIAYNLPESTISRTGQYVEISNGGKQLSRKQMVPAIEALVGYCGQYCYIKSLGKWVARDFLKVNDRVREYLPMVSGDEKGRVCRISFLQAKKLLAKMGLEMLSLKEYWQVYEEAFAQRDSALCASLVDSDFLEFLDTCAMNGKLVHKPVVKDGQLTCAEAIGEAEILYANPGLISPVWIDKATGLPSRIFSAANYYDKSLWRYWSPMEDKTYVFSRSYIFLLQQPCLDAKSVPEESFVNMGIRSVRRENLKIEVHIAVKGNVLTIMGKSEYDKDWQEIICLKRGGV